MYNFCVHVILNYITHVTYYFFHILIFHWGLYVEAFSMLLYVQLICCFQLLHNIQSSSNE